VNGSRRLALFSSLIGVLLQGPGVDGRQACSRSDGVSQDAERGTVPGRLALAVFLFEVGQGFRALGSAVNVLAFSDLGPDFIENPLGGPLRSDLPSDIPPRGITPGGKPGITNRDPVRCPASTDFLDILGLAGNLDTDLATTRTNDLPPAKQPHGAALLVGKRNGNA